MAEGEKKEEILQDFFSRSRNAKNEEFISHEFEKFASDRLDNYLSILQGKRFKKFSFKVCNHLFHKKLRKWILNRIYREEEFLQIINYFECEPHRELIIQGAKNRVRDRKKKQEQKTFKRVGDILMNSNNLNKKIGMAAKWSIATEIAAKLISPVSNMILARFLTPEAFGVVATVTMVTSFADMFTDAGFQKYLVQPRVQRQK